MLMPRCERDALVRGRHGPRARVASCEKPRRRCPQLPDSLRRASSVPPRPHSQAQASPPAHPPLPPPSPRPPPPVQTQEVLALTGLFVSHTNLHHDSSSHAFLKSFVFEWVQSSGSREGAVLHRGSLPKVPPTPSPRSPSIGLHPPSPLIPPQLLGFRGTCVFIAVQSIQLGRVPAWPPLGAWKMQFRRVGGGGDE